MTRFSIGMACLTAVILSLVCVPAESQEQRGTIDGVVRDNTGAVLPGVTVTATSPALIQPSSSPSRCAQAQLPDPQPPAGNLHRDRSSYPAFKPSFGKSSVST